MQHGDMSGAVDCLERGPMEIVPRMRGSRDSRVLSAAVWLQLIICSSHT